MKKDVKSTKAKLAKSSKKSTDCGGLAGQAFSTVCETNIQKKIIAKTEAKTCRKLFMFPWVSRIYSSGMIG